MNVAFRVDASSEIGDGHFFRCLTLADALHKCGWQIRFVSRNLPDEMSSMLADRGFALSRLGTSPAEDAADTIRALSGSSWEWLIVDHYALDARWEAELRQCVESIAVIDDLADRAHDCDLLLDQNLYTDADRRYAGRVPARCRLMLGPIYALLREEFRAARRRIKSRDGEI